MAGLQISCPNCGKTLKLPDRSLLGRKGKCSKCRHSFRIVDPATEETLCFEEAPDDDPLDVSELYDEIDEIERRRQADADEVPMEIVEPSLRQPPTGTSARWVPDAAAQVAAAPPAQSVPYPAMMPQQIPGYPGQWPPPAGYPAMPPGTPYPAMAPQMWSGQMPYGAPQAVGFGQPAFAPPNPVAQPFFAASANSAPPIANDNPVAAMASPAAASDGDIEEIESKIAARKRAKKRKQAKQRQMSIIAGVVLVVLGGTAWAIRSSQLKPETKHKTKSGAAAVANSSENENAPPEHEWDVPTPINPTKGEPIELRYMPYGVTAILHLRPAELWAKGSKAEEFRFCWGPLGEWAEKQIKEICKFDPPQISEVTFGLIPGIVGEPLHVAAVVRLKESVAQKTDLTKAFKGDFDDSSGHPVYIAETHSYVIKDLQTFAAAPKHKQAEMVEAVNRPNAQGSGIEALLRVTDRQRQIVVMFEPAVLEAHRQFILPKELDPFAQQFLEFFNAKQIETAAWSLHVSQDKLHSEILLRNKSAISKANLQHQIKQKLDKLPHEVLAAVQKMDPQQVGPRQLIGRFPVMLKVFSLSTLAVAGERHVSLTTALPERAAPNLAIGALLTWDESTRTDFNKAAKPADKPKETTGKLPDLVVDRLKQKMEIEFTRTPLQDAFKFIADECKIEIDIDGDALKSAGFTKNMPQTMTLGKVSGLEAISAILQRYAKEKVPMLLVIDEPKKKALITTKEFAEKDKLTPFALPDPPPMK